MRYSLASIVIDPNTFSKDGAISLAGIYFSNDKDWGTNPCCEIALRPFQFCNLSEIVVRADDTLASLKKKSEIAAIIGTLQATLTDFRYLRNCWKKNTDEEALVPLLPAEARDVRDVEGVAVHGCPKVERERERNDAKSYR